MSRSCSCTAITTSRVSSTATSGWVPDAEAKVKELVDGIERGVFWPATDTSEWRWDFADWIFNSPEESVDPAWIADQLRRIEG